MAEQRSIATQDDVQTSRRALVGLPALTCIVGGGFMAFAGLINLLGDTRAGFRYGGLGIVIWAGLLVIVGALGVSAGVSLSRGRRSGWALGLIALPLIAAVDAAYSMSRDQLPLGAIAVTAAVAWIILLRPRVRRAFTATAQVDPGP